MHISVVEPYRTSSGGEQKKLARSPAQPLSKGLDRFKRIVAAVLKLLIEEQPISQAGLDTEVHTLRRQPGVIPQGVSNKVSVHFKEIACDHQFTFLAAQLSVLDPVLVLLQAQAVGMKCKRLVYYLTCFRGSLLMKQVARQSDRSCLVRRVRGEQFLVEMVGIFVLAVVTQSPRQLQFGRAIVRIGDENFAKEPDGVTV